MDPKITATGYIRHPRTLLEKVIFSTQNRVFVSPGPLGICTLLRRLILPIGHSNLNHCVHQRSPDIFTKSHFFDPKSGFCVPRAPSRCAPRDSRISPTRSNLTLKPQPLYVSDTPRHFQKKSFFPSKVHFFADLHPPRGVGPFGTLRRPPCRTEST